MRNWKLLLLLIVTMQFAPLVAIANQPVSEKGMATITFKGRKPSPSDYREAEKSAEINSIKRYIANTTNAESRNFSKIRSSVSSNLANYVLGSNVISKQVDRDSMTLTLVVRTDLDASSLSNAIRSNSSVVHTRNQNRSYIGIIYIARRQDSITRYGSDKYSLKANKHDENGSKNTSQSSTGGLFADEHSNIHKSKSSTTHTQHSVNVKYRVATSGLINSSMTGVITDSGYRVVPAKFLKNQSNGLINPAEFEEQFSKGNDISAKTLMDAAKGARQLNLKYLAVGTMNIGIANKDTQTGLERVFVTTTGKLYDFGGMFPQTIVSIGPEQFSALGPTESAAEINALKLASKSAARKMTQAMDSHSVN